MGILVTHDGTVTLPGLLLIIGIPLIAIGQYKASNYKSSLFMFGKPVEFLFGTGAIALGMSLSMVSFYVGNRAEDREDLKYESQGAEEILCELRSCASLQKAENTVKSHEAGQSSENVDRVEEFPESESVCSSEKSVRCLNALALKCGKEQARRKREAVKSEGREGAVEGWSNMFRFRPHELELLCQEAAYIVLEIHPDDDDAVSSALSLLALVAGDDEVRRRNIEEADRFGLNTPVKAMRSALARAKGEDKPQVEKEQASAELQRKGCLLLGALSNDNEELATKVVDEEGLIAVLDAVDWYRLHEDVANWGLWAVFVLCYDHLGNKGELIKLRGVDRICRAMKDIPKSIEVARHGMAVLFDMMREMPGSLHDVSQIRMIALNAGMHDVVKNAMVEFAQSKEIMMMGQQMLVATGYKGTIPQMRM